MANPIQIQDSQQSVLQAHLNNIYLFNEYRSELQKKAIEEAKSAYLRLPHGDAAFQECVAGKENLGEILATVQQKRQSFGKRKTTKFLQKVQKYTVWLHNISGVVDIAVQSQAGIGCPLWAPIKFVLKVSL